MSESGGIFEFIDARLDHIEAVAGRAAHTGDPENDHRARWVPKPGEVGWASPRGEFVTKAEMTSEHVQEHILTHDPAKVALWVNALRALVALHVETMWDSVGPMCDICKEATGIGDDHEGEWPCLTLRHVASIWWEHADYRMEWASGI